jgi:sulfatase modifying factor 1
MRWPTAVVSIAMVAACSAAPRPQPVPASTAAAPDTAQSGPAEPQGPAGEAPAPAGPVAGALDQSTGATQPAVEKSKEPSACPDGMVLVEGDYCTKVEQKCLKSWWDKSNKKKVCEQFEPPSRCVGERIHKRFCIDMYAWPNQKGERPEVMNNFYQAQVKCAAVGKRMCTESEWTFACEGPEMKPFPHGYIRDPNKCNGDHPWDGPNMQKVARRDPKELARLWRGVPSGTQPRCISDFGVADLPANNDEVVASEPRPDGSFRGRFSSVNTGGPWYQGVRNQCRPKIYTHEEGFYYYFLGFRCCAAPDGKPNDPRTPKQIAEKKKLSWVERLGRFTVAEVQEKLALKKKLGHCKCDELRSHDRRMLCNTICGTLLGPGAVDGRTPEESASKVRPLSEVRRR